MRYPLRRFASVALSALALGSCTDGTGPSANAALSAVLAQFVGAEPFFAIGLERANAPEVGPTGNLPGCLLNSSSTTFVCPEITTNGISVTRTYQLLDASALPVAAFAVSTVAAIRITSNASGTINTPASFSSLAVVTAFTTVGEHIYSGFLSGPREINGEVTTVAAVRKNGKTTYTTTELAVSHIVPPVSQVDFLASDGFGFPMSGKITSAVAGTDTLGVAFTAQVETTFNGTPVVVTVVARSGTTVTYTCTYARGSGNAVFVTCTTS